MVEVIESRTTNDELETLKQININFVQ